MIHPSTPVLSRHVERLWKFSTAALVAWLLLAALMGCRALPCRGPCPERVIAARELSRLGLQAKDRGSFVEAEARFVRALEECPEDPHARHHYAKLLWQRGELVKAIEEMDTALRHSGDDPRLTVELGEMLLAQNELDGALECATCATAGDRRLASAWALRGDVLRVRGQLDEARRAYHRALRATRRIAAACCCNWPNCIKQRGDRSDRFRLCSGWRTKLPSKIGRSVSSCSKEWRCRRCIDIRTPLTSSASPRIA